MDTIAIGENVTTNKNTDLSHNETPFTRGTKVTLVISAASAVSAGTVDFQSDVATVGTFARIPELTGAITLVPGQVKMLDIAMPENLRMVTASMAGGGVSAYLQSN